jgi:hypothetical protein
LVNVGDWNCLVSDVRYLSATAGDVKSITDCTVAFFFTTFFGLGLVRAFRE